MSSSTFDGMKWAGYWGQELRADTVELHCHSWQPAKDFDTFHGRCVLCSITRLVRIKIDANYFASAVCDCFWRLHRVGEAYNHYKVDQSNAGQPACIVHAGSAADFSARCASVSLVCNGRSNT